MAITPVIWAGAVFGEAGGGATAAPCGLRRPTQRRPSHKRASVTLLSVADGRLLLRLKEPVASAKACARPSH